MSRKGYLLGMLLLGAAWCGHSHATVGVVSQCASPVAASGFDYWTTPSAAGTHSVTFSVGLKSIGLQSLDGEAGSNSISLYTMGVPGSPTDGCGSVTLSQLPAGTYQVTLLLRVNLQPFSVVQRSIVVPGGTAPPGQPPVEPPVDPPADPPPAEPAEIFESTQSIGEIPFSHSVSLDGGAQVSIPIWVPPGRQSVQPSLALVYSSRAGNGLLGAGWSLAGLSSITTCRQSPALDGAYGGRFPDRLCLDGVRLLERGRSIPPPLWISSASYEPGAEVQFASQKFRARRALAAQPTPPAEGPDWQLLGPSTATIDLRTEVESYRRIVGHWITSGANPAVTNYPDAFDVYSSDGMIARYASRVSPPVSPGSGARIEGVVQNCSWGKPKTSPGGAAIPNSFDDIHGGCVGGTWQRRVWMLDVLEDRFGNRMEIDYLSGESMAPREIRYTSHASAPATKKVLFEYEPRPDIRRTTLDGLGYRFSQRLKGISIEAPLRLSTDTNPARGILRRYSMTYDVHPVTAQSILTKVTECAGENTSDGCLEPLTFKYAGMGGMTFASKSLPIMPSGAAAVLAGFDGFRTADVNGDGLDDILFRALSPGDWNYRLSDGVTVGDAQPTGIAALPDDSEFGASLVNLDRNQVVDAIFPTGGSSYSLGRGNLGGNFQLSSLPVSIFTPNGTNPGSAVPRIVGLGDFNGDTLPDLAVRHACRMVGPRTVTTDTTYVACKWGIALNQATSGSFNFTSAMDLRWSSAACTETPPTQGFENCAEAQAFEPAFVADLDGNGENELIVPIRRLPGEQFFRGIDTSMELRAFGFPLGTPGSIRGTGLSSRRMPRLFLDVNGDGLPDAAHVDAGRIWIAMNAGGTFAAAEDAFDGSSPSATVAAALSAPNEMRVGDFNNDGLEDIYLVSPRILLQSTGSLRFVEKSLPIPPGIDSCVPSNCPDHARRRWDHLLDFDGDGLIDVLQMTSGGARLHQRYGTMPGLLESIAGGPLTAEVRFTYKSAPKGHIAGSCSYPQFCLNRGMWMVSEVGVRANVASTAYPAGYNRVTFGYSGGRFDVRGRGWLGVSERTATDEQTLATTTVTMDNQSRITPPPNTSLFRYPGAFRPMREVMRIDSRRDPAATGTIQTETTEYLYSDSYVGPVAVSNLTEVRRSSAESVAQGANVGAAEAVTSMRESYQTDLYGLVTKETREEFDGAFTASGAIPPNASVRKLEVIRNPVPPRLDDWLVQQYDRVMISSTEPARAAVAASATEPARPAMPERTVTRRTDFEWQPSTMSARLITVAPDRPNDKSLHSITEIARDPTGNPNLVKVTADAGNGQTTRETRFAWDALDQTLLRRQTDSMQHTVDFTYYAGLGELYWVDDANQLRTTTIRDRFGRVRRTIAPSSATTTTRLDIAPGGRLLATTEGASGATTRLYIDKWGSVVREERSRLHGKFAIVERKFTRLNQLETETLPFYDDERATPQGRRFTYDNLGRPTELFVGRRDPAPGVGVPIVSRDISGDTLTWKYAGLSTEYTNSRGVRSTTEVDGSGREVRSATIEPQSGRQVVTRFEYGPFGVLDAITDSAGNRLQYGYDNLDRRTTHNDPSAGTVAIGYNGYGEIKSVADGAGGSTIIERDLLGRPKKERFTRVAVTTERSFTWDTATGGIGNLAESTSSDGIKTVYEYDEFARPAKTHWDLPRPGGFDRYTVERVWDNVDRISSIKYPMVGNRQFALVYHYEPQGTLYKVSDGTNNVFWTLRAQDASGLTTSEEFGDSTSTTRYLDPRKRLKLIETRKVTPGAPDSLLQRIAYDYGSGGYVIARHDVSPDRAFRTTEEFGYDFLGRITNWTTWQNCLTATQQYQYDDLGNLTQLLAPAGPGRTATLEYGPAPTSPNAGPYAVRKLTEGGASVEFQYDTGGRQTSSPGRTITWNEFNLPRRVAAPPADLAFKYDAAEQRISKQSAASESTIYVGGAYERRIRGGSESHVFNLIGPAGVFGQVTWSGSGANLVEQTRLIHRDLIDNPGTISAAPAAATSKRMKFEPFGQRRYPWALAFPQAVDDDERDGFTGHETDGDLALINMGGRIYDPALMRFLSDDPVQQAPGFSQSLNRYAYALNNPVNVTDPTGFCPYGEEACISQGAGGGGGGSGSDAPSGPLYSCASWNPFACLGGNPNQSPPAQSSPSQQQPPTKEDSTRKGADPGPGWGASDVASAASSAWQWFKGQMQPFALANQGSWERLKQRLLPPLIPQMGSLTPPELRSDAPTRGVASIREQMSKPIPTPFDPIINSVKAHINGDFKAMGAEQLDAFLFTFGPVVKDLAFGDETARLMMHKNAAVEDFNQIGFTANQTRALIENPHLADAFRGHQIDRFFKIRVAHDEYLGHLRMTLPGAFGPDVYHPTRFVWWDLTTPRAWTPHVPRYGPSFGSGTPLLTR